MRRILSETRALSLPAAEHLQALARRGGTRAGHAFGFFVLFVVALLGSVFVLDLFLAE